MIWSASSSTQTPNARAACARALAQRPRRLTCSTSAAPSTRFSRSVRKGRMMDQPVATSTATRHMMPVLRIEKM
jgi:hypothetical protein